MSEQNGSQLYILSIAGKTYIRTFWRFDPIFRTLEATAPYSNDSYFTKLSKYVTISIWKYPFLDGIPEFLWQNGRLRIKGRI